jgi:DNA-binding YbaB/EbfC family protein
MKMAEQPSLSELMKTAQKMQDGMRRAQEELANKKIEGHAGGNMVTVTMNGRKEITAVHIGDDAIKQGKTVLEDLVRAACNDASQKVEAASQDLMMQLSKELGLPPNFELPTGK